MPSAEHSKLVRASLADVWDFVRDMDNWAPLVTGYERHEKLSDEESIWFLKGELGGLTRIAEFKVNIDEWDEAGRVRFSLKGVNEPVTGSGSFDAVALGSDSVDAALTQRGPTPWARWRDALVRLLFATIFGHKDAAVASVTPRQAANATSEITFKLNLTASGMAGMVLNALLTPMMKPVAEDLADKIAATIERG